MSFPFTNTFPCQDNTIIAVSKGKKHFSPRVEHIWIMTMKYYPESDGTFVKYFERS